MRCNIVFNCPCQESNLIFDLRRVACIHHTSKTWYQSRKQQPTSRTALLTKWQHEREDSNPIEQCWKLRALPGASLVRSAVGIDAPQSRPSVRPTELRLSMA